MIRAHNSETPKINPLTILSQTINCYHTTNKTHGFTQYDIVFGHQEQEDPLKNYVMEKNY